jgi:DNA-binding protein WhiA
MTADGSVPDLSVLRCEFCGWSFVKGLFLACGTITQPDNAYHMEFLLRNEESAFGISSFLSSLGVTPKITERRGGLCGVYYKDSESVVDILGHLGANRAAFKILDVKIMKELRNNANRVANCESANIGKTVAASNEQMRAIETIIESGRADELPDELRQTLDLRAAFPNDTLLELASKHQPPITKSGVNHRLRRLVDFSKKC